MLALVLLMGLLSAACGSRLDHSRLLADAQGTVDRSAMEAGQPSVEGAGGGISEGPGGGTSVGDSAPSTATTSAPQGTQAGAGTVGGPAPRGSGTPAGCTGPQSEIVIGSVGEYSGVVGSQLGAGIVAVKAWVASMNARGGLHCHPLRFIAYDDGGEPSKNQALTQRLIERDKAIAMVYLAAPLAGHASVDYVNRKRVPAIGSDTQDSWFVENPMYFPQATSSIADATGSTFAAMAQVSRPKGQTKVAILACSESANCSQAYTLGPKLAAKYGLTLVYRAQATLTQPDYTANCQAAKNAGAELFFLGMDNNSIERIARSCASINFKPMYGIANLVAVPRLASNSLLEGAVAAQSTAVWFDTGNASVAEFQRVLKQYAPGQEANAAGMAGWISAKLFEAATKNLAEPPSSKSILEGLWSIRRNDLNGSTAPLTFNREQNNRPPICYWITQIAGGKWVSPNGFRRTCE